MKNLALIVGLIVMTLGVCFGLWVAIWWGWILGIVMVVEAVKANPVDAMDLAIGIVRVLFANVLGAIAGWIIFSFGAWIGSMSVGSIRPRARTWK